MRTTKRGSPAQLIFAVVIAASCSVAGLWAQTLGQPPVEACKPGDFTVVGYPDEFGPKPDANFRVLIDEKFNGQFLTTDRIWVPVIQDTIRKVERHFRFYLELRYDRPDRQGSRR